jgi:uncharacterized protein YabE (DUF348 family)
MIAAFAVTLVPLFFVLISSAEAYNPQVAGEKISAVKPVVIIDNGVKMSTYCAGETVDEIFAELGIACFPEDRIKVFPDPALGLGTTINIERATPIILIDGGKSQIVRTFAKTVQDLLSEKKITIKKGDRINVGLTSNLKENMVIAIIRIKLRKIKIKETIDYGTIVKEDPNMLIGQNRVDREGKAGKKEVTFKITYENGIEISRKKIDEKILTEPIDEIVVKGTKMPVLDIQYGRASYVAKGVYSGFCAAHRTYDYGDRVRVTNLQNGRAVIVTICDWGPMAWTGRIIDVSYSAAVALGMISAGHVPVKVELLY